MLTEIVYFFVHLHMENMFSIYFINEDNKRKRYEI